MRRRGLAFAAAAVAAAVIGRPEGRGFIPGELLQQQRPNVLLITLDTTRADRIGAYGYKAAATPVLDALAAQGIRFADATSQSPITGPAHAALLTGQYPGRFGIKTNASTPVPESATTVAEVFRGAGYRTGAFIGAFVVDRSYGFAQGFDTFDADFRGFRTEIKGQVQRRGSEVVDPALAWLKSGSAPFFAWVHLYDAHAPYDAPARFGATFRANPYDGEIAYVDSQVGRLVEALRAAGALDRTIVVAVADHGESLGEHGEEDHGIFLYEPVMRIPWIMRIPGVAPRVVTEQVRSVDLAPTLADLAGLSGLGRIDGESLASVIRGTPRREPPASYAETWYPQMHFGWSRLRSLRVGEWKYIDAPKAELYDLRAGGGEKRNVLNERGTVASRMAAEIEATERSFGDAVKTATPQPDAETIARLRSLGYVGLAAPSSGRRGKDPKDGILQMKEFRRLLTLAGDDLRKGLNDAAIIKLRRAVTLNEQAYDAHVLLGSALQQKQQFDAALGEFEAAALLNPTAAAPHVLAAELFMVQGRFERAMASLDRAAQLEPESGEVAAMRGRVFERAGRGVQALAQFQRAVELNPSDLSSRGRLVGVAMNMRRPDLAEPHLKVLLERNYQPARTHFAMGQAAQARGDRASAERHYTQSLALEPGFRPAREALAALGLK